VPSPQPLRTEDHPDGAVARLLSLQQGTIARWQALEAGLTAAEVRRRQRSGQWAALAPGVYGLVGHAEGWRRQLWAAHLHAGPESVISHEAGGRLHDWPEVPADQVTLSVPAHLRHRPAWIRWHRIGDLVPQDVVRVDGLPVTSPARTAVDLASVLHVARLRLLVERGVVERSFTVAQLGATLDRVRRRGKPGVRRMASVLDDLGPGTSIPHSELERLLAPVLGLAGLPPAVHEHPLPGSGPRSGFVDRCWPEARLIVEADGRRWHTRRQQMRADQDRTLQAQAVGYETSRLGWEHLAHDPTGTAVLLRAVWDQRMRLLHP
jgi:hypothetical protein